MTYEITENGIKYKWWLEGSHGTSFRLFPVKGKNNQEQITDAKAELRKDHEVQYIHVEWITTEQYVHLDLSLEPIAKKTRQTDIELNPVE